MSEVTRIEYTFHADSCGDDASAGAFEAWAQVELERRYPDATIRVRADYRTSGAEPPVYVEFDEADEDTIVAEVRELWTDWERADWPGAAVEGQAARDEAIAALSGLSTYQIACRSASLDDSEREANRDTSWARADDVREAIERGDCDDCEISLCAADADEACDDAERSEATGYVAPTDGTEWLILTITRPASDMRAGLVDRYYWPRGGW